MSRRIKYDLIAFFEKKNLTTEDNSFIMGCMRAQKKYPQLTNKQWDRVMLIYNKYIKLPDKDVI